MKKNCLVSTTLLLLSLCTISSCANTPASDGENILGIYKVSDRNCVGTATEIDDCNSIALIEFVKGSFYKIADDEIAFVIWRGEPGSDLLYTARKYEGDIRLQNTSFSTVISEDERFKEEIWFSASQKAAYSLEKKSLKSQAATKSILNLEKTTTADLQNYSIEYPGNN